MAAIRASTPATGGSSSHHSRLGRFVQIELVGGKPAQQKCQDGRRGLVLHFNILVVRRKKPLQNRCACQLAALLFADALKPALARTVRRRDGGLTRGSTGERN